MATLGDLADRLEKRAASLEKEASTKAVAATMAMVRYLVEVTPVDTTKAMSNWQIGIKNRPLYELPAYAPGYLGYTAAASGRAVLDMAERELATKKPGDVIYLSNLAPYIVTLNTGTSRQEPAGFVERAILIGQRALGKTSVSKL
jgi:hypothetical protein